MSTYNLLSLLRGYDFQYPHFYSSLLGNEHDSIPVIINNKKINTQKKLFGYGEGEDEDEDEDEGKKGPIEPYNVRRERISEKLDVLINNIDNSLLGYMDVLYKWGGESDLTIFTKLMNTLARLIRIIGIVQNPNFGAYRKDIDAFIDELTRMQGEYMDNVFDELINKVATKDESKMAAADEEFEDIRERCYNEIKRFFHSGELWWHSLADNKDLTRFIINYIVLMTEHVGDVEINIDRFKNFLNSHMDNIEEPHYEEDLSETALKDFRTLHQNDEDDRDDDEGESNFEPDPKRNRVIKSDSEEE